MNQCGHYAADDLAQALRAASFLRRLADITTVQPSASAKPVAVFRSYSYSPHPPRRFAIANATPGRDKRV